LGRGGGKGPRRTRGVGVEMVESGEQMAAARMGRVAWVSKFVTAVTAVILSQQGVLDLEKPIKTYLPRLPPRLGSITMAQLLSHTAGLAELTPSIAPGLDGSIAGVCAAMTDDAFVAEPGLIWGYSSTGFTLAECVVEAVGR